MKSRQMLKIKIHTIVAVLGSALAVVGITPANAAANAATASKPSTARPNIVVILADDVGYSDISAFGSEIKTPNIDSLVHQGRVLTNFHTTPLCATSRAELLTGTDHHLVGMGEMGSEALFYPPKARKGNYAGKLDSRGLTVATILKNAGYNTYMAGKWDLTTPVTQEGFDQSFSLAYGADFGSNFSPAANHGKDPGFEPYFENGKRVKNLPADFFSSDYYTTKLIDYIRGGRLSGKPFFAYLAFQAAHFPLQAPAKYLNCKKGATQCYKGVYEVGYEKIRQARIERMKKLGIIPEDFHPWDWNHQPKIVRFGQPGVLLNKPWDQLTVAQKKSEARIMDVYAAMLTDMDNDVGRLIDYLKSTGQYKNTMFVFLSDNGADGNGYTMMPYVDKDHNEDMDNSLANYGRPGSFIFRSTRWAEVGEAPFRMFKMFPTEGGISVPAIIKMPDGKALPPSNAYSDLRDVVPTILAAADVRLGHSTTYKGREVSPIQGISLLSLLDGQKTGIHPANEVIADEVGAMAYVRQGPWKMTRIANYALPVTAAFLPHQWQLYNIDQDRGENHDVYAKHPEVVKKLKGDWDKYVDEVQAVNPLFPPRLQPMK